MTAAFLVDRQFRERYVSGVGIVSPFDEGALQAASIDLKLGDEEIVYDLSDYVLGQAISDDRISRRRFESRKLDPGETVFITLKDTMRIPEDCLGLVFARSSLTRLGVLVAPVYMNPGYEGQMPLTITNAAKTSITLMPDVRVAQLVVASLAVIPMAGYSDRGGKYAGEAGSASLLHADPDIAAAVERVLARAVPENLREKI